MRSSVYGMFRGDAYVVDRVYVLVYLTSHLGTVGNSHTVNPWGSGAPAEKDCLFAQGNQHTYHIF